MKNGESKEAEDLKQRRRGVNVFAVSRRFRLMAAASMIWGILSLLFVAALFWVVPILGLIVAPVGLVLGIVVLVASSRADSVMKVEAGRGMAIAGVVMCTLAFILSTASAIAYKVYGF